MVCALGLTVSPGRFGLLVQYTDGATALTAPHTDVVMRDTVIATSNALHCMFMRMSRHSTILARSIVAN